MLKENHHEGVVKFQRRVFSVEWEPDNKMLHVLSRHTAWTGKLCHHALTGSSYQKVALNGSKKDTIFKRSKDL